MSGTPSEASSLKDDEEEEKTKSVDLVTPLKSMDQSEVTTWLKQDLGLSGVAEKLESLGKNMKCDIDGALLTEVEEEKDLEELVGTETPRLVRKKLMSALREVRSGRRRILARRVEEKHSEEIEDMRTPVKMSLSPPSPTLTSVVSPKKSQSIDDTSSKTEESSKVEECTTSSDNNTCTSSNKTSNQQDEKIAIVGYSCILPGGKNVGESWDVIRNKIDCIGDIPKDRVDVTAYYHPEKRTKDKIYCKKGGFIPDFEFDALEYNLNMLQLEDTDMNQILSLVKVKEALVDAELETKEKRKGSKIGCVLGIGGGQKASHEFFSRLNYVVVDKVLRKMGMNDKDVKAAVEKYV